MENVIVEHKDERSDNWIAIHNPKVLDKTVGRLRKVIKRVSQEDFTIYGKYSPSTFTLLRVACP